MSALPFIQSGSNLTVFLRGVPRAIDASHPNHGSIMDMIRAGTLTDDNLDEITKLVDYKAAIETAIAASGQKFGKVTVGNDAIFLDGTPLNTYLADKMLAILSDGHDITPWAKFMDKLYQNPSKTAVDELYLWLEKAQMPLTPEGNFLAYKKVDDDFNSFHKGPNGLVVTNRPGDTVEMLRNAVDDNRNKTCSAGLHFCSWHYLPSYYGSSGKVVIVEINPADVVSIPSDYDNAKGRAWRYVVKSEIAQADCRDAFANVSVHEFEDDFGYGDYEYDDFGL